MTKYQFSLKTFFIAIVFLAVLIGSCNAIRFLSLDFGMRVAFEHIEIGTMKKDVVQRLGVPMYIRSEFSHELWNYDDERTRVEQTTATEYYVWRNGVNWYYLGFDPAGKLVLKSQGDSQL
jgi:hypothetical protein